MTGSVLLAIAALLAADLAEAQPEETSPLALEEVLESTRLHYPPLLAAIREIEAAEGDRRAAEGKFDTGFGLGSFADRFGFYENHRLDVGVEQAVQWWGAKLYAGWRVGEGGFAPYNGLAETRDGGEYRAGFKLPLLRDRAIDPSRAELERTRIGITIAELSVLEQQLLIRQLATWSYWDWVASGRSLQIAQSLLELALDRDLFLRESVDAGALPAIEVTDNRRAILKRRSDVVSAEQKLRKAAIYLSLYYRDPMGNPAVPGEARLPERFPAPSPFESEDIEDDFALALERRPELRSVRAEAERVRVDESLFSNAVLPSLDLALGVASERGVNPDVKRGPTDLKASLSFSLPIQRREAEGKRQKAQAKLYQLLQKEQFLGEKIEAEVRDAAIALEASYRKTELLEEEVAVTRELESLERERFDLGDSNLFTVNLREAASADAENRRIEALADYHRARALYRLVIAEP